MTNEQPFGFRYRKRPEYIGEGWLVRWWPKDGTWHVAVFDADKGYKCWTNQAFNTAEAAVAYAEGR